MSLPICPPCPMKAECAIFNLIHHKKGDKDKSYSLDESEIACINLKHIYVKTRYERERYEPEIVEVEEDAEMPL